MSRDEQSCISAWTSLTDTRFTGPAKFGLVSANVPSIVESLICITSVCQRELQRILDGQYLYLEGPHDRLRISPPPNKEHSVCKLIYTSNL